MTSYTLPSVFHDNLLAFINPTFVVSPHPKIINKTLSKYLNNLKEQIDTRQEVWDKCKKFTNSYEYIHTVVPHSKQAVCPLKPLSRSFYKMIEMAHMMNIHTRLPASNPIRTFHLAEGPGGFIEAIVYLRKTLLNKAVVAADQYIGMTLLDDHDHGVPGWKKSRNFLITNPTVQIEKGADLLGDLRNPANLQYVYDKYKATPMHLVTGDGGFDFTEQYTDQESVSANLIFCQIAFALALQGRDGDFVIKFFDTFTKISLDMLFLLSNLYDKVSLVKPVTSRPANSEKYIVCQGFKPPSNMDLFVSKLKDILTRMQQDSSKPLHSLFDFALPYYFTSKIEDYNATMGQQQIENILLTLNIIDNNSAVKLEPIKKQHIDKCITWCQLYQLPYNRVITTNNIFLKNSPVVTT